MSLILILDALKNARLEVKMLRSLSSLVYRRLIIGFMVVISFELTGCGGGSGGGSGAQQENTQQSNVQCDAGTSWSNTAQTCVSLCSEIQEWDSTLEMCVDLYWVCDLGTNYPDGFTPDEFSSQDDCLSVSPAPSYYPVDDEVVMYVSFDNGSEDFTGVKMYRWGDCWVNPPANAYPGDDFIPMAVDPIYGGYMVFDINAECSVANYIISYPGGAPVEASVGTNAFGSDYNRMEFVILDGAD